MELQPRPRLVDGVGMLPATNRAMGVAVLQEQRHRGDARGRRHAHHMPRVQPNVQPAGEFPHCRLRIDGVAGAFAATIGMGERQIREKVSAKQRPHNRVIIANLFE